MKTSYIIEGKRENLEKKRKICQKIVALVIMECKGIEMKRENKWIPGP